jgi:hypothetical protein
MWARDVEELRKSDLRQRKIRRAQLKAVAEAKRNERGVVPDLIRYKSVVQEKLTALG